MRFISRIIIHCSDSDAAGQDVAEIRRWHLLRSFHDIGYHYVIVRDGAVQKGRPEFEVGAHTMGFNHDSIGICLVGKEFFHWDQFRALFGLLGALHKRFPDAHVFGHRDFTDNKTCPNFELTVFQSFWNALKEGASEFPEVKQK